MQFALFQMPPSYDPSDDARVIAKSLRQAELADELGFSGVWISEHLFTGATAFGDPIVYATAVACRTKRVEIGFGVLQLALHHPVRLALQLSALDQMCQGRLRIGVARGSNFNEWEYAGFGLTMAEGRERFQEALDLLLACWTTPDLRFRGKFFSVDVPHIRPQPVQLPHPPIYRAALTPESTAEIGRAGQAIMFPRLAGPTIRERLGTYEEALRAAGHEEARVQFLLAQAGFLKNVYVAPTDAEAWADVEEPSKRHMQAMNRERRRFASAADIVEDPTPGEDTRISATMQRGLVVGSPTTVRDQLRELQGFGLQHVLATVDWGDMPPEKVERSMRLIASDVLPGLATN